MPGNHGAAPYLNSLPKHLLRASEMQPRALGTWAGGGLSLLQHHFEEPCGYNILCSSSWPLKESWSHRTGSAVTGCYCKHRHCPTARQVLQALWWRRWAGKREPGSGHHTQDSLNSSHNIETLCVVHRHLTAGTWVNSAALPVSQPLRSMPLLLLTWGLNRFYILSRTFPTGGADSSLYPS